MFDLFAITSCSGQYVTENMKTTHSNLTITEMKQQLPMWQNCDIAEATFYEEWYFYIFFKGCVIISLC